MSDGADLIRGSLRAAGDAVRPGVITNRFEKMECVP
jgi:hypothetical protein